MGPGQGDTGCCWRCAGEEAAGTGEGLGSGSRLGISRSLEIRRLRDCHADGFSGVFSTAFDRSDGQGTQRGLDGWMNRWTEGWML